MNHKLQQHYENQKKLLPVVQQQALDSFNWLSVLLDIGKKYTLQLDELEDLQIEVMLILVGLSNPIDLEDELGNKLPLSPVEIDKLLEDVNTNILEPIHDYIVNGGPVEKTPLQSAGVSIMSNEYTDQNTSVAPMRIEPLPVDDMSITSLDPLKRSDIIEHKLDDIFHETLEHVEHI
jgi:hypothetical protein